MLLLLTGCSVGRAAVPSAPSPTATALPPVAATAQPEANDQVGMPMIVDGLTVYPGEIVAQNEAPVVAEVGGRIMTLDLEVGQRVIAGGIVAQLDATILEAQREQALAALQAAQAQAELLKVEADETEIEAARAAVGAAEAAYNRLLAGPSADEVAAAEAAVRQAEAALADAQAAYDQVAWNPLIASLPESQQLADAKQALADAQARYDELSQGAAEDMVADAYAEVAAGRARLHRLEVGPEPAEIAAAAARLREAETALYVAQLQLDKAAVRAPIDGIVARVDVDAGAMVTPGTTLALVLTVAVKLETQVAESRMAQIHLGQPAYIRVDAFPDRVFAGAVAIIAPQVDPVTRTVRVTVRPVGDAAGLTPGMTATLEFDAATAQP